MQAAHVRREAACIFDKESLCSTSTWQALLSWEIAVTCWPAQEGRLQVKKCKKKKDCHNLQQHRHIKFGAHTCLLLPPIVLRCELSPRYKRKRHHRVQMMKGTERRTCFNFVVRRVRLIRALLPAQVDYMPNCQIRIALGLKDATHVIVHGCWPSSAWARCKTRGAPGHEPTSCDWTKWKKNTLLIKIILSLCKWSRARSVI